MNESILFVEHFKAWAVNMKKLGIRKQIKALAVNMKNWALENKSMRAKKMLGFMFQLGQNYYLRK